MATAIMEVAHWPAPQAIPRAATTQIEAAVVRPWTLWWDSSRMITPPPRKPMPAMMPCTVRSTAADSAPARSRLATVMREAPRATRPWVRMPAGLPHSSRSRPMRQPTNVATERRTRVTQKGSVMMGPFTTSAP